jgi:hypothetical protein
MNGYVLAILTRLSVKPVAMLNGTAHGGFYGAEISTSTVKKISPDSLLHLFI